MMKLWQRYLTFETLKMLILFLGSFYLLYIVIDYALRTKAFNHVEIPFFDLCLYYLSQFSKRAALLVPFALLIACIKVLSTLSIHNELIALRAGGIALKRIASPLLGVALACSLLLYANFQWVYPFAWQTIERFEESYFRLMPTDRKNFVNVATLADGSNLVYQSYHPLEQVFEDVYWIRTPHELYRMQRLSFTSNESKGYHVDHLFKGPEGSFERVASYKEHLFPSLPLPHEWQKKGQSIEQLSLNELWQRQKVSKSLINDRGAQISSQWHMKLALPLLCFLVVIAPAPWCLRFRRHFSVFLLYSLSIALFLTLFTSMDAALILSESRLLPPIIALWTPIFAAAAIFGWRYSRL